MERTKDRPLLRHYLRLGHLICPLSAGGTLELLGCAVGARQGQWFTLLGLTCPAPNLALATCALSEITSQISSKMD
jgi:hypothetical protein